MKQTCILSLARQLTEEEQSLIWQKPPSHIESEAERRIYQEVVRNWKRGEMKISTILLEGDAGSGKTQIAKALSADFNLPYTKVTCFADMDKSDVLGSIFRCCQKKMVILIRLNIAIIRQKLFVRMKMDGSWRFRNRQ